MTLLYRFTDLAPENEPGWIKDAFFEMTQISPDTWRGRWGLWGSEGIHKDHPMSEWEETKKRIEAKGYKLV